jgi:hypothetical protein
LTVRCPECAAEISALREFCPECGAPTDPELRTMLRGKRGGGEADDEPPEQLKRNRKALLAIGGGILVLLAVSGRFHPFGIFEIPEKVIQIGDRGADRDRSPVTIDAAALYQAYADDEAAADRRFDGREMVVTGEFLRTVPDGYGSVDMRLKTPNAEGPLGVDLDGHSVDAATRLKPGEQVTVSCRGITGSGNDHWLQSCTVLPPAEVRSAEKSTPAPPEAPTPPESPNE